MGLHEQDQESRGQSPGFLFCGGGSLLGDLVGRIASQRVLAGLAFILLVGLSGMIFLSGLSLPGAASIERVYSYSLLELREMARKDSAVLNGAPAEFVQSLFHEPEMVRSDDPVAVWQYRTGHCVLDVYLSVGEDQTPQNVLYAEVRARDSEAAGLAWGDCVPELLEQPLHFAALDSG